MNPNNVLTTGMNMSQRERLASLGHYEKRDDGGLGTSSTDVV